MTPALATSSHRFPTWIASAWTLPLWFAAAAAAVAAVLCIPAVVRAQTPGAAATTPAAGQTTVYDVILTELGPSKIMVIKEVRDAVPGMGLAQAKALVESPLPQPIKRGVTMTEADTIRQRLVAAGAKATIEAGGVRMLSAAEVALQEDKGTYDVILTEFGQSKIAVIKAVRDSLPGLGLAEAKTLVESAPQPVKLGATRAEAEAVRQRLEAAGAKVQIK